MRLTTFAAISVLGIALASSVARAAVTGYVNNPTGNSVDWTQFVLAKGATLDNNVNFDSHPNGALQPNFYLASDGVSLSQVNWGIVETGTGSATGSAAPPQSPGEGPLGTATYLTAGGNAYSLTASFSHPVLGAGFMFADYFNALGDNTDVLEAFSGPNATGALLGQFDALPLNFELNNLYFMGLADTSNSVGSVRLSGPGLHGDSVYLDRIVIAAVPEPGTVLMTAIGAAALLAVAVFRRWLRKSNAQLSGLS